MFGICYRLQLFVNTFDRINARDDHSVAVEHSDVKSETSVIWISKAVFILMTKPKSGQAYKLFSLLKKKMSLNEAKCV